MDEVNAFGTIVLLVSLGFALAIIASKLTERFPVPAPALFLLVASIASPSPSTRLFATSSASASWR